jgi:hypothetical protein
VFGQQPVSGGERIASEEVEDRAVTERSRNEKSATTRPAVEASLVRSVTNSTKLACCRHIRTPSSWPCPPMSGNGRNPWFHRW